MVAGLAHTETDLYLAGSLETRLSLVQAALNQFPQLHGVNVVASSKLRQWPSQ